MSICKVESKIAKVNKVGRPPVVLTDEQIKEVEEMSAYFTIEQISDYLGISHDTFTRIKQRNDLVLRAYKKGRMRKVFRYAKILENKAFGMNENEALKYDTTSIIFFLKTQAAWSEKQQIETKDITPKVPPSIILHFNSQPTNIEHQEVKGVIKEKMKIS